MPGWWHPLLEFIFECLELCQALLNLPDPEQMRSASNAVLVPWHRRRENPAAQFVIAHAWQQLRDPLHLLVGSRGIQKPVAVAEIQIRHQVAQLNFGRWRVRQPCRGEFIGGFDEFAHRPLLPLPEQLRRGAREQCPHEFRHRVRLHRLSLACLLGSDLHDARLPFPQE